MSVKSTRPRSSVSGQSPHADPPPRAGEGNPIDAPPRGEGNPIDAPPRGEGNRNSSDLAARRSSAVRRRRLNIYALRVAFAVLWIGSWELTTSLNWVDPFFFGHPSGIVVRLWTWITDGTALGPLWLQVAVTMQETVLGFLVGSVLGAAFGILLGRVALLAEI